MKLGYIFSRYPLVTETFILREIAELVERGHEVTVAPLMAVRAPVRHRVMDSIDRQIVSFGFVNVAETNTQRVVGAPLSYVQTLATALMENISDPKLLAGVAVFWPKAVAIAADFERRGIDRIHAHFATFPAMVAWMVNQLTGIPYSFTAHAHDIFVHRAMLARKLQDASFVVTISRFNRDLLLSRSSNIDPTKVHVIHCGVPLERFSSFQRSLLSTHSAPLRILSVGALQPYKGHSVLIEACAQLRRRLDIECRIIGGGRLQKTLAAQIARLNLGDSVRLVGACDEDQVRHELAAADVFALASVQEPSGKMDGIPVALMEAMASGVPVVASRLSGIPELVEDGRTGLLAAPGDATGLANAIWRLQDPLLREALARDGRLRVQQEFDLHKTVRQLADLFEDRQVLNEIAWRRQEEVWAAAAARRTAAAGDQPGSPASDVCSMGWEQREPSQVKAAVPPKAVA